MKKIESGSVKYLVILIIMVSLFGIVLYPLFDLILCNYITNTKFTYSIHSHLIQPITFGIVFGVTFWLVNKKRK